MRITQVSRFQKWIQSSVKRRLIFLSTLFWVLSVVLVIVTFQWAGQSQLLKETRSRNIQVASIVSRDINAQVSSILSDARVFSAHLETLAPALETQAEAMLALRISAPQRYQGIYYLDTTGELLLHVTDSLEDLLLIKSPSEIVSMPPVEPDLPIFSAFQVATMNGYYVSDAYFTRLEHKPVFYVGQRLTFSDNTTRIVVLEVDIDDIWQRINLISIGQSGYTYVATSQGIIVAHPDPAMLGKRIPDAVEPLLTGIEGSATYREESSGNRVLAAYSPVGEPTGWGVVVVQDESELNATVVKTGAVVVGIWLFLAMLGTVSILFMVGKFTGPIAELTRTTHDIALTGNLKKTSMTSSHDEVGQLSQAFDNMIERLENTEGRLAHVAAEERTRLARDLHDAVSQTLFSASIIAEVLPKIWEKNPDEGRKRLEEVRHLTKGALAEMRMLLFELRPSALADAELGYLVRQLAEGFTGRLRIPVNGSIQKECLLPPDVKVALYRIAQEALNNIAKHAAASEVKINLACKPDALEMYIADNGRGFDITGAHPDSLGLGIMRDRTRDIGASISIKSSVGKGTEILVNWPARNKEAG
jgi:signal transduction histidine kinase